MSQIEPGTVVRLKSGGPNMTVSKIREWNGRTEAVCDWFDGTKPTYNSFPLTSLEVVVEEQEPQSHITDALGGGDGSWMR